VTGPVAQSYVSAVIALYLDLPDTPLRAGPHDHRFASRLQEQAVPLALVESALLLASLRRLTRPAGLPPLSPIRSLAYFEPLIAELQQAPLSVHYTEYLRHKLARVLAGLPAPSPEKDVSR
jgi:hypothetical protein